MTTIKTKNRRSFVAWFLAAALLLVGGSAVAHELDHQLHKHEAPCALHLYAGHLDGVAPIAVAVSLTLLTQDAPRGDRARPAVRAPLAPYAVRAPPRFS